MVAKHCTGTHQGTVNCMLWFIHRGTLRAHDLSESATKRLVLTAGSCQLSAGSLRHEIASGLIYNKHKINNHP